MSYTTTIPSPGSHSITVQQAADMNSRYRFNRETILAAEYKNQEILALNETFNRDIFEELLVVPNCAALRIYYGMSDDLKVHAILVAVNENNEDILPDESIARLADNTYLGEDGQRCPNVCPPPSPLNHP